jgi:hypothetical protein
MAFSSAITARPFAMGNKRVSTGTFTQVGGDTGGNIDTGLRSCEFMMLQTGGAAVSADQSAVNETFPCAGSAVTIVTTDGANGFWLAVGL